MPFAMPPTDFDVQILASPALEMPPGFETSPRAHAVNACHRPSDPALGDCCATPPTS